jgi:hypothetical protein
MLNEIHRLPWISKLAMISDIIRSANVEKKIRSKIIKKQLFLEECINLYKNNSTSESHRFNYVKIVSYRNYRYIYFGVLKPKWLKENYYLLNENHYD